MFKMWSLRCHRHWRLIGSKSRHSTTRTRPIVQLQLDHHTCSRPPSSSFVQKLPNWPILRVHSRHFSTTSEPILFQIRSSRDILDSILKTLRETRSESYPYFPDSVSDPGPTVSYVKRIISESDVVNNKEEMVALIQSIVEAETQPSRPDLEQQCLDRFQQWVGKSKLGIGFLLYQSHNLKSGEFITRIVAHLGQNLKSLNAPEFVTLMLMIHFRKLWDLDELIDVCNPSLLQEKFAKLLELKQLSMAEICACCLGFRRIRDFQATNSELRLSLYESLCSLARLRQFLAMDQLVIIHLCLLINEGKISLKDNQEMVKYTLNSFREVIHLLDLETSTKVMTLGMLTGMHDEYVTDQVLQKLAQDPSHLSLRSSVTFLNFLIRVGSDNLASVELIRNCVLTCAKNISKPTFQDLADVWSSLLLCSLPLVIDESYFRQALTPLSQLTYSNQTYQELSDQFIAVLFESTFHGRSTLDLADVNANVEKKTKFMKGIVRLLGNLQIDKPDLYESLNLHPSCIECLFNHFREIVPAGLRSDDSNLNNLPAAMQFLGRKRRELNQVMGFESACDILTPIPLFTNPMVVFGHIGGNCMTVEAYLEPDRFGFYRAPDIGEWVALIPKRSKPTGTIDWYWEVTVRHLHRLGFEVAELCSLKDKTSSTKVFREILIGHSPRPFLPKRFRQSQVKKESTSNV